MESLIASYASSDDEDGEQHQLHLLQSPPPPRSTAISSSPASLAVSDVPHRLAEEKYDPSPGKPFSPFLSLPKPRSSASSIPIFPSLPKPKSSIPSPQFPSRETSISSFAVAHVDMKEDVVDEPDGNRTSATKASALFPSLPPPKSNPTAETIPNSSSSERNGKKIVHVRLPFTLSSARKYEDDEEEEEEEDGDERKKPQEIPQSASVQSFLSSIPAPKYTSAALGALPSSTSGHRLVVEDENPNLGSDANGGMNEVGSDSNLASGPAAVIDGSYSYYENWEPADQNYAGYEGHGGYESNASYQNYESHGSYDQESWDYGSSAGMAAESFIKASGKRGRDSVPTEIVEVKQDELMKDRPREDQVKLTGIAFGPAYQPTSTKGKPLKLHKRKHQIGSLYYDMKQKEMELAERRARGFLTKAQTHAKYGW